MRAHVARVNGSRLEVEKSERLCQLRHTFELRIALGYMAALYGGSSLNLAPVANDGFSLNRFGAPHACSPRHSPDLTARCPSSKGGRFVFQTYGLSCPGNELRPLG